MLHYALPRWPRTLSIASVLLLVVILFLPAAQAAQSQSDLPTRADLQSQLDALTKQKTLSADDKLTQKDLTETLEMLDKVDRVKEESNQLKTTLAQAPAQLKQASDALSALTSSNDGGDEATRQSLDAMPLRQLETRLSSVLDQLQTANNDLSAYNSQLVSLQTQPERAQNEMYNATQQLQQVRSRLNGTSPGDSALRPGQKTALQAQQVLLNAQIDLQRKSLEGNTALQDALQKQRDYTVALINNLQHTLQLLQESVNKKRLSLTEKTAHQVATPDDADMIQNNPLVRQELEVNQQISQRLINATQNANELVQRNIQVKNWLDRAQQSERNLKEQISVLKGSLLLSRILYQQQQTLPSADQFKDLTNQIADLRLEQFDINQQRDALFQGDEFVSKLVEGHSAEVNDDVRETLLQIIDSRRELLDQLNKQLGNQLITAINLQINQQQLMNVSTGLQETLTQQIFWVKSNKPMDWDWLKAFPGALHQQLKNIKFDVSWHKLGAALFLSLFTGVPLLLLAVVVRTRFKWIDNQLASLATRVGQLRSDSQLNTPKAIGLNLVKLLPFIFTILAVGLLLQAMQSKTSTLLWAFSKELALFWLVFGLSLRVLTANGLAVTHFAVQPTLACHYRRQILRVSIAMVPLLFWSVVVEMSPLHLLDDVLGQGMIFLNLLLIAGLVFPMCRDSWRNKESHTLRLVTITVLSIVPIVLLVLTATGYFYTALRLANRWIDTVYLVIIWNLIHQTVIRGLSVAARRMAYRRALSRRQNMVKEGAEGAEPVDEPPLGIEQINQQTMRLTMLLMFSLFAVVFYAIWSDLITVFAYLDSIILWHNVVTEAGVTVVRNVTMGSLLFAFVAAMVAWALIRNLPGLLEVLILSRLNLRQGASYAITTILKYAITVIGAMLVFGSLGVSWDKLQWLAAALSVGLGFGLQEIFGNFVSGLIILFERPVRIGDTVTIGNFSGTVSKIRIRATTITDFDRKEVIIPNKAFVTERLINWSLTDTVTRVVIRLGVAYGSDLDKVKEVLLKVSTEHPRVMRDPEPSVYFTEFGPSTLAHELRFYVRELRDRSSTVDALNRQIDKLCRENNINIAFNQLEVHLHNEKGEALTALSPTTTQQDLTPPAAK